jgi:hypothetical protein
LIKIHALSCILILTALLLLPTSFVGLKSALADSVIRSYDVGNSQNHSVFNPGNSGIHLTNFFSNIISAMDRPKVVDMACVAGHAPVGIASSPRNNDLQIVNPSSEPVYVIDRCYDKVIHTLRFHIDCAPFTSVFNPTSNNNNNMHLSDAFPNTVFIVAGLGNKVVNTIILGN